MDGGLLWLESDEHGTHLRRWTADAGTARLTPPGVEVGNSLHAYGGGAYTAHADAVWFSEAGADRVRQLLLRPEPHLASEHLTAAPGGPGDLVCFAGELFGVQEHDDSDTVTVWDLASGQARDLLSSPGFLAAPRPAPGKLAWMSWSADVMPWDSAQLWCGDYTPDEQVTGARRVAGGPREAVAEPRWGPDGSLYFVSDRTGWMNLYRFDGRQAHTVVELDAECAAAGWELGYSSYAFLPSGTIAVIARRGPRDRLVLVEQGEAREVELPFTSIKPYLAVTGDRVAMIAATPLTAPAVVLVDPDGAFEVIAGPPPPAAPPAAGPVLDSTGGVTYLLHLPEQAGPVPLIVRAHPGPTDGITCRRDAFIDHFTRHGFAVADVDYRGSTGYGRAYRQALYRRWGLDDVADCATVAQHLIASGVTTAGQVIVMGASAGGYTALHAASSPGPFVAAIARSPITDPKAWAASVPRFQRAHALALDGGAGRVRAEEVRVPVLLVHGAHDPITPASGTLALARDLQDRHAPVEVLLLDTDSHTLSSPHLADAVLAAELRFARRVLGLGQ